jgi:hypothetical protein
MMHRRLAANQRGTADPKIALNLAEHHSTLENIDVDDCVVVQILSSASLHALLLYEKGFAWASENESAIHCRCFFRSLGKCVRPIVHKE